MKKICFLLFSFNALLPSCKEKVMQRYPDGTIEWKQIVLNWKENNICWVFYNEDQSISDSIFFYGDSIVKMIEYRNNKKCIYDAIESDQRCVRCYFSDGKLYSTGLMYTSKEIGNWSTYYPNGNIQVYESFDSDGRKIFFREYDQDGNAQTTMGSAIYMLRTSCDTIFPIGERFTGDLLLVDPPDCNVKVDVSRFDDQGNCQYTKSMPIKDSITTIEFAPKEKGTFTFVFDWRLEEKTGKEVLKGSYVQNFIVQ